MRRPSASCSRVKDLESRPIERVLRDVADLVKPSESKAQIVSYVIATKFRRSLSLFAG